MKVAPVYRRVLKQLHTACHTRPHYVQDIRFLLSFPLQFTGTCPSAAVPSTTSSSRRVNPVSSARKISANASKSSISSLSKRTSLDPVEGHLQRPSSECLSIDTTRLFERCYSDLNKAVRESGPVAGGMNPVAMQIVRYRNLLWLQQRLARVLSSKTKQLLATSLSISRGPTDQDFIPDDFFEQKKSNSSGGATPSAAPTPQQAGAQVATSDARLAETAPATTASTWASADIASKDVTASSLPGAAARGLVEAVEEGDPDIVYSAGAIGQQQEVFVLRHREAFPMAAQFLAGFPTVTAAELATCAFQQAALTHLVRQKFPTKLTCQDASVSLSVSVEPYDVEYTNKEHAGMGYFAAAHRQFRVRFSLEPLSPEGTGAERSEVLVVNSYFVRLDMELMQLVEEVGYLHSSDVLRMLRERDYGDHFSEFIGSGMAEVLGEEVFSAPNEQKEATAAASPDQSTGKQSSVTAAEGSRVFSLYFSNHSDAPMVLKGLLYYKVGRRRHLAQASIQCIPFGFLLMEA
ncbi:hypothetical protein GH5_01049 [Leishmania sp. Ghana 2012 LV757]|uniref:hypothetical protein n=1 Tax=Leishmania sp. Ghana 2012 LV757 TaxID=2803181 RepID=UPI001B5EDD84|nr:hypothetical protein GH5_01049 [Leishmania sp. Ghana 2012 LV757]